MNEAIPKKKNVAMTKERTTRIGFGPCVVPVVPYSSFTRMPAGIDTFAMWRVIGPTVGRNIDRPLWLQFVAVYMEGLNHGAGVMEEMRNG